MSTERQKQYEIEYGFVDNYRRFWYNADILANVTTTSGKDVIKRTIADFEETIVNVSLPSLPFLAMIPNMITLYLVLLPILGTWPTRFVTAMIELIPLVLSYFYFRSKEEMKQTYFYLLVGYYVIVFALVIAYKVYIPDVGASLASLGWLLLPAFSIVAMITYGSASKQVSEIDAKVVENETVIRLKKALSVIDELKESKDVSEREMQGLQDRLNETLKECETLRTKLNEMQQKLSQPTMKPVSPKPETSTKSDSNSRRMKLIQILFERHESESVENINKSAIAKELETSHTTVANDLRWLEKNGYIDLSDDKIQILKT